MSALKTNTFYSPKVNQYYLSLIKEAEEMCQHCSLTALSFSLLKTFTNRIGKSHRNAFKMHYDASVIFTYVCVCFFCYISVKSKISFLISVFVCGLIVSLLVFVILKRLYKSNLKKMPLACFQCATQSTPNLSFWREPTLSGYC